jgi:hypothetical protein
MMLGIIMKITEIKLTRQYYPELLVVSSYVLEQNDPVNVQEFKFDELDDVLAFIKAQMLQ